MDFENPSIEKNYVQPNHWQEFSRRKHRPPRNTSEQQQQCVLQVGTHWTRTVRGWPHHPRSTPPATTCILVLDLTIDQFANSQPRREALPASAICPEVRNISCLCSTVTVNLVFSEAILPATREEQQNREVSATKQSKQKQQQHGV